MLQLNESDVAIHFCTFQAFLQKARVNLRFPSLFFVEWKTINGKNSVGMVGRKRAVNSMIDLHETLLFTTEMLYHRTQKQYLKKQSLFHVNLISNSRPDQVKLVGRVVIDLSQIGNTNKYHSITTNKLMYCSVDAQISFSLKLTRSVESNIQLNQLDRSSFSDLYSFTTSFKNNKNKFEIKDVSERRVDEERRKVKTKLSQRQEILNKNVVNPRTQNILIKDLVEQINEVKSQPQSLPLTQKKPPQDVFTPQKNPINNTYQNNEAQKKLNPTQFQNFIHKQKDNLERQLNQHKNKIKKLQIDMKEAMKLFQQSQNNSQLNKSKLIQSEQLINSLKENQEKLRQQYQRQIDNIKQGNLRQIQLLKAGCDADIKILQGTIEQLRLKVQDFNETQKALQNHQQIIKQNNDLKSRLKNQEGFLVQLAQMKIQNTILQKQKSFALDEINLKCNELNQLKESMKIKEIQIQSIKLQSKQAIEVLKRQFQEKSFNYQSKNLELQEKLSQTTADYQGKLIKSSQALLTTQQQKQSLQRQLIKYKASTENNLNQQGIQNYQKLKDQHQKLTLQLQKIKKSIIFPEDHRKVIQQEDGNTDLFVIMQRSQLQQIEISELKQENSTIKEKIAQMTLEQQHLRSQQNLQLQAQQLNLIKEQLAKAKQSQEKYIQLHEKLQKLLDQSKLQINRLSQDIQILRNNHQLSYNPSPKPQELNVTIQLRQIKIDNKEKGQIQISQQSPAKQSFQGHQLVSLDEPHHEHQHHHFNFQQHNDPLTHEEINKISQIKDLKSQEVQYLMEEILKLKEQIQQLRQVKNNNNQSRPSPAENNNNPIQLNEQLHKLHQENIELRKQIGKYQDQKPILKQEMLVERQTKNYLLQLEQQNKDHKNTISNLQVSLVDLEKKNQLLQDQIKNPSDTTDLLQRYNTLLRELQIKLANLEEQMKIKDELLAEGEKNLQENYTMKYQLADLKDKYSEIKSALQERDQMINYLQQTKQQLSKQLQKVAEKSEHLAFSVESRQIAIQQSNRLQVGQQQLYHQVEALKKELISLNNNNTELRNQLQEKINTNLHFQKTLQQNIAKTQQIQKEKKKLQAQINDLSLIINGLNTQLQRSKYEIQNTNEQINTLSLRNNETALQILDLKHQNQEITSKLKNNNDNQPISQMKRQQSNKSILEPLKNYQIGFKKLEEDFAALSIKYSQNNEDLLKKQEKIVQLALQLQSAKYKLQQIQVQHKNLLEKFNPLKTQLFQVQIHQADSINEAMPMEYSKSIIPLYQRDELQKIQKDKDVKILYQEIESLKKFNQQLQRQLAQQSEQKYRYFNDLQSSNTKVHELQRQIATMKQQMQKLTSLPIQSFNYMATPIKPHHYAQTYSRNLREPSIMFQPRVKAEIPEQMGTPIKNSFQKDTPHKQNLSKDIQTRVETNVQPTLVNQNEIEQLKKELEIIKEQLESEAKIHNELRQIHKMSEQKYDLLNKHYENCIEQINHLKTENQALSNVKQNITNELYQIKNLLQKSQNQNDQLLRQYNEVLKSKHQAKKQALPKPKIQQQNQLPITVQLVQEPQKISLSFEQKMQYERRLQTAMKNQERLNNKIILLEDNIHNLEKAFQEHIELTQSNDKITQKLEQLNELQSMATQLRQQSQEFKIQREELAKLKIQNEQLQRQKQQLLKLVEEHSHCIQERAQWQQKLQQIQNMLSNNQNKFSQEKVELQNKVIMLNQEKANLQAQKSAIYQTIKKQSSLVIDNQIQQLKTKQAQLFLQVQILQNEKIHQMQRIADLQQKIIKDSQQINKKQAEFQQALGHKEQQVEQIKFINIQLNQELQEIKMHLAQNELVNSSIKAENTKLFEEKEKNSQQIITLRAKMEEHINIIQTLTHKLSEEIKKIEETKPQIQHLNNKLQILQAQITQKFVLINQLMQKLQTVDQELHLNQQQILKKSQQLKENQQRLSNAIQQIQKKSIQNKQLSQEKQKLQLQLQRVNARYFELQNAVKNKSKITDTKDKLTQTLKNQIIKKEQQIKELAKRIESKDNDIINLNKQIFTQKEKNKKYELTVQQLIQKEILMRQTMEIIENQSRKIVQALQNRYQSQQNYYRMCLQKQKENNKLNLSVIEAKQHAENKERILTYEQQKAHHLKNQLQIMKRNAQGQSAMSSRIVTVQYEKYEKLMQKNQQLMNKNKQYLQIINNKSMSSIQNEKLKQEIQEILQKMNDYQQNHNQAKQKLSLKLPQLQKQLQLANKQNRQLHERITQIMKQLDLTKQTNLLQNHTSIENMLAQKDNQIKNLKKAIAKSKQVQNVSSVMEEIDNSSISILNDQILNLNRELLEKQSELNKLKTVMNTLPLPVVHQIPQVHMIQDEQKQKMKNELLQRERREQQYKQSINKLKEILKLSQTTAKQVKVQQENLIQKNDTNKIETVSHDLHNLCQQIKDLCQKRNSKEESDKLFQAFLQKYDIMEQQFNNLNCQTSIIQQKAKFISKQLQKIKSFIIKNQNRSFKQKTELLSMIKPCETAATQLVNISQTLSEKESQNFI